MGGEQNFCAEKFYITKVIQRHPRVVYELEVLKKAPIEGQFYQAGITPFRIWKQTAYKID